MIKPETIEVLNEAEQKRVTSTMEAFDGMLEKDRGYAQLQMPHGGDRVHFEIARRYLEAGWSVKMQIAKSSSGQSFMIVMHPNLQIPAGVITSG